MQMTRDITYAECLILTEFDGKRFSQKCGTDIGTRMAPAYANLFMHDLETQRLNLAPIKPYLWLRYIWFGLHGRRTATS